MTLEEQLKEFPEEFTLALERAKELQFPKVVNYGVEVFNIIFTSNIQFWFLCWCKFYIRSGKLYKELFRR